MNTSLLTNITKLFNEKFKQVPKLIFSPGRINLIGEHTDYNQGFVFPAAIDKGIYAAIQKSDTAFTSISASDLNQSFTCNLNQIKPTQKGKWKNYVLGVVSEIQKKGKTIENFNLIFGGDIPSGSGLSSSAALENAVVFGLNELFQLGLTKKEMIFISQKAEHNFVGVQCGIMDQYASMFGESSTAILLDCSNLKTTHFKINFKDYDILLINSNVKHSLANSAYNDRRTVCEKVASLLQKTSLRDCNIADLQTIKGQLATGEYDKALYILEENTRVLEAAEAIKNDDLVALGTLLYKSHRGLQHQYQVSCAELDFLVDEAKKNTTILGARMMGGGFGGCTINIIKKSAIADFSKTVQKNFKKKFNRTCSIYKVNLSKGTHLI